MKFAMTMFVCSFMSPHGDFEASCTLEVVAMQACRAAMKNSAPTFPFLSCLLPTLLLWIKGSCCLGSLAGSCGEVLLRMNGRGKNGNVTSDVTNARKDGKRALYFKRLLFHVIKL